MCYFGSEIYMHKRVRKLAGDKGITSYFIKWFAVINAFGNTSDPVFIVADNNMKENIIDIHEIPGLGIDSKGYVVFCKTRCGNKEFLEWFNEVILIKFIKDIRSKWNWTDKTRTCSKMKSK